ncbi:hypothetical protein ACI5KX_03030 [Erythrobacter sp. GH1-10]|uniref:hypothetical protein n=1 Tax=Erythrobacter sp. GH1-10 TaxID=3349334 RepID=UPI003877AE87
MTPCRALTLVLLPLAGAALQGCVAAAIPLVAGGAIARTATDDKPGPRVEVATTVNAAPEALSEPAALASTDLAETAGAPAAAETAFPAMQSPRVAEFIRYSTQRAFQFSEGAQPLETAVLRDPSALDGKRLSCEPGDERDPAILIDLDPGQTVFAEGSPLPASGAAALSLEVLRAEGVTIAWISENSAADAYIVRDALKQSGLDPDAEDTLLLMRYPGDRKQTRREEFAAETCLIAIAGDEHRDFDELYEYLTNRDAALELEPLMNNGWFLIGDAPVAQPTPVPEAETAATDVAAAEPSPPEVQGPPDILEEQDQ